jgi:hypothetical protein
MQLKLFAQILPGVATAFVALIVGAIAIATSNQLSYAGDWGWGSCTSFNREAL